MKLDSAAPFDLSPKEMADRFGLSDFELAVHLDYDSVRTHWIELNKSYKDGELSLDWQSHQLIWEHFYQVRYGRLWILCAMQKGTVRAIFPMIKEDASAPWSLCDEFIIGREYFCPPDLIHRFALLLSSIHQEDMSSFYLPHNTESFLTAPSGVIDLKVDAETFWAGFKQKNQKEYQRIRRINADLITERDHVVRREEIAGILRSQLDYWVRKKNASSEDEYSYSRDKIHTDLKLMERAAEMGKLMSLYFYEGKQLIAANFSVRRGKNGVDDYLCLRDCSETQKRRSLGIFAILENMNFCRDQGLCFYDLSACMAPYKESLINTQMTHYHLYRPQKA